MCAYTKGPRQAFILNVCLQLRLYTGMHSFYVLTTKALDRHTFFVYTYNKGSLQTYIRYVLTKTALIWYTLFLYSYDKGHIQASILFMCLQQMGVQWLSGRVLDSRPRGCGIEPHRSKIHCVVVHEQDTFILAKYWFNPGRHVPV